LSEMINRLNRISHRLIQEKHRIPTIEELSEYSGKSTMELKHIMTLNKNPYSLQESIGENGNSVLSDTIEDKSADSPIEETQRKELCELVHAALTPLTERERIVLRLRFGIGSGIGHTLEEIGCFIGLTRERIRQIESRALEKLRHPSRSKNLKTYS